MMTPKKAIIYDNTCPMCRWYTDEFVKAGLLESENRIAFSELEKKGLAGQIDLERSRDEIPLVDLEGGVTLYGLDSMVHLLALRFPFIPRLLAFPAVGWFFRRFYKFVSFNRRVMAPSHKVRQVYDCTPHFDWKYRWVYILSANVIGWLGIGSFLASYLPDFVLWIMTAAFLSLHFFVIFLNGKRAMEYAGQLATVWLLGGFFALPGLLLPGLAWFFAGLALLIMAWQGWRRWHIFAANG